MLKDKSYTRIVFEQGYYMNSPSRILTSLRVENDAITTVYVGGDAVITGEIDM